MSCPRKAPGRLGRTRLLHVDCPQADNLEVTVLRGITVRKGASVDLSSFPPAHNGNHLRHTCRKVDRPRSCRGGRLCSSHASFVQDPWRSCRVPCRGQVAEPAGNSCSLKGPLDRTNVHDRCIVRSRRCGLLDSARRLFGARRLLHSYHVSHIIAGARRRG